MSSLWFNVLVVVAAMVAGAIASVTGFGIGSLLTPILGFHVGTKIAVAAVSIPHRGRYGAPILAVARARRSPRLAHLRVDQHCRWVGWRTTARVGEQLGTPTWVAPGNEWPMARMRVKRVQGRYAVTITGRLSARDLRRLEHACGSALDSSCPLDRSTGLRHRHRRDRTSLSRQTGTARRRGDRFLNRDGVGVLMTAARPIHVFVLETHHRRHDGGD